MEMKPRYKSKTASSNRYPVREAARIRARLNEYRAVNGTAKDPLSIRKVLDRMLECDGLAAFPRKSEDALDIEDEWLRRFCTNKPGYEASDLYDRVDAIRIFLMDEGVLTREELVDGDVGEMLAVHGYLANGSAEAVKRLAGLGSTLGSTLEVRPKVSDERSVSQDVLLHLDRDSSDSFVRVEEHFTWIWYDPPARTRELKGYLEPSRTIRYGYGFLSTKDNLLHVFLRGKTPRDRVHYVEMNGTRPDRLVMVRIGARPTDFAVPVGDAAAAAGDSRLNQEQVRALFERRGIFEFSILESDTLQAGSGATE